MFTNDPLQTQLTFGAYAGAMNPFGLPYSPQTAINPALVNPFAGVGQTAGVSPFGQQGYGGIPNYGAIAQQQQQLQQLQQLASILASQGAIPQQLFGQTSPWQSPLQQNALQNPLLGQNPLIAASLQNPLFNPILAQQLALQAGSYGQSQFVPTQYGQIGSPFAQTGFPLAPQSWVGQQLPGQIHPHHLSQLAARGIF
jgi:hypothetical protein